MSTLSTRLKVARTAAKLSQEELGIRIGIDPASASTRMNRYELGKRTPDPALIEKIAHELELPVTYFHATGDLEATLLVKFHKLPPDKQVLVLSFIDSLG